MKKVYSVFDDFPLPAVASLEAAGMTVTVHPSGIPRPSGDALASIIREYDIIMISTSQKIEEETFENITSEKIIATASIGTDHIHIPAKKKDLIHVINAPVSNRISVAEHTFALIFSLAKELTSGRSVAVRGLKKAEMARKPSDIHGLTIGVVGAGGIASEVLTMAKAFGLKRRFWTKNPSKHTDLISSGAEYLPLDDLLSQSDIISVNLPLCEETSNLIFSDRVERLKKDAIFISTSRNEITDNYALLQKAKKDRNFRLGLDFDADKITDLLVDIPDNVVITPHIAGGTVESRIRMFYEITDSIISFEC